MSAAGQQNGSGPGTDGLDLAALRASLRCGRSLPVVHLADLGEVFEQRHYQRDPLVLCCADVAEPNPDLDDPDCPGCRDCVRYCPDCVRYCPDCVREALRFSAEASPAGDEPQGDKPESESFLVGGESGPQNCFFGECGHRCVIDDRGRIEPCPCDTETGAELPDPVPAAPGGRSHPAP